MATEISILLELLEKSSISSCINKSNFGCLLLKQCKCNESLQSYSSIANLSSGLFCSGLTVSKSASINKSL